DPKRLDQDAQSDVDALSEAAGHVGDDPLPVNQMAEPDAHVLDVIRIDDGQWWLGNHVAGATAQRWPGGIPLLRTPQRLISRAWLKTAESIAWSGITISRDDVCAEIGSAPGGSCQRLLELGAKQVIAIDPADMDSELSKDRRIQHIKKRGREVPHRQLSDVTWLFADSNVAPVHTLDTVEGLVTGTKTNFRGLVLTLKFNDASMLDQIGGWIDRVKSWGFSYVRTRQLAWGRQEICLVALRQKSVRRFRN
ncbi:MAG: SAM-dependent methyltransferase, partial [Pirellulaceae bacterium]